MNTKVLMALAAFSSMPAWATDFVDTARVISSTPIYERVNSPRQSCWTETVNSSGTVTRSAPEERSIGGALIGGVVGGIVGNQVGQGHGNTAATAAGAIAGAIIGDRLGNQNQSRSIETVQAPQVREERRCRQVDNYTEVIRGYNVTYRYSGHDVTVRLPDRPGNTLRVGVSVVGEPLADEVHDTTVYDDDWDHQRRRHHDHDRDE